MKNTVISCLALLSIFLVNTYGQLEMNSSGNVGIGTSPSSSYKLYTVGNTYLKQGYAEFQVKDNVIKLGNTRSVEQIYIDATSVEEEIRLYPSDDGYGYIGTSTNEFYKMYTYRLYVDGVSVTSDGRLKENIRELASPLQNIVKLRGVKYDLITSDNPNWTASKVADVEKLRKDRIGFIAQELSDVYPELVEYDESIDQYSVDYLGMIPILVEALKEQQTQIEDLQRLVKASNGSLKAASVSGSSMEEVGEEMELTNILQNHPNPFTVETTISYYLAENTSSATLFVYDMTGKQLKNFNLSQKGSGEVTISGGELDAGLYMYSLVADGKLIGTKQMILTK